jgi:hypothetical protein
MHRLKCGKYTIDYYLAIKKMNGTGDHNVDQDKPSSKSQTSHVFVHMQILDLQ